MRAVTILRVRPDGRLRSPFLAEAHEREGLRFAARHASWVQRERARIQAAQGPRAWSDGTTILLRGERVVIHVIASEPACHATFGDRSVAVRSDIADVRPAVERDLRALAHAEVVPRLHELAAQHGVSNRARHGAQPAVAVGVLLASRRHRPQLPSRADANGGLRVRSAARVDARPAAESLGAVLASRGTGVSGIPGGRTLAEDGRPGALLSADVRAMRLTGTRCSVRPWRLGDGAALVRHGNNINIARQLRDRFPHPYTRGGGSLPEVYA